jgi:haloalkane dehalogenase
MSMEILATPTDRFATVRNFDFPVQYANVPDTEGGNLRIAYRDIGPSNAPVVVMLHGEPTWSFLYRNVVPPVVAAGYRVIVPDLVGFGASDKPTKQEDHTYARHVEWVRALLLDHLDLTNIALLGQDWGGLIGLRIAAENLARFRALIVSNTGLPTGDFGMPDVWLQFREAVRTAPTLDVSRLVAAGTLSKLPPEVLAAYDAPFPDESFKAAPRAMPSLVPTSPDDPASEANRRAWAILSESEIPTLVAFADSDPITAAMGPIFRDAFLGARGRDHPTIANAGHFVQEDQGDTLGEAVATFLGDLPPAASSTKSGDE